MKTRLSAWMFAPLLVACGSEGSGGSGGIVAIPDCTSQPGSVLSTDSAGQLICKDLPAGAVSLPNCKVDSEALTSDGKTVFCTNRNNETSESRMALENISKSETLVTDYGTRIMALGTGPGAKALYVGNTTATTPGRIDAGGTDIGIAGAVKLCTNQYGAGARMCTVYDIYQSIVAGKIISGTDIAKSWVYMEAWKNPAGATGATKEPTAGLNENCAGYTYKTGDQSWVGTAFVYAKVTYNNNYAPKFYSGSADAACSSVLPVACCK
jgi:hypothetical protein